VTVLMLPILCNIVSEARIFFLSLLLHTVCACVDILMLDVNIPVSV